MTWRMWICTADLEQIHRNHTLGIQQLELTLASEILYFDLQV